MSGRRDERFDAPVHVIRRSSPARSPRTSVCSATSPRPSPGRRRPPSTWSRAPTACSPGTACADGGVRAGRPAVRVQWLARRRRRRRRRARGRRGVGPAPVGAHRRAQRTQLPLSPVGRGHAHPSLRRAAAAPRRASGTPARPCPGCGRWRRRRCGPAAASTTAARCPSHPGEGQPPRRRSASPRPSPRRTPAGPVATVEVECDPAEQVSRGDRRRRRRGAARQHDARRGARLRVVGAITAPAGFLVEVSGGVTLDTVRPYADAGADLISTSAITHSAPALDLALDLEYGRELTCCSPSTVGNTQTSSACSTTDELVDHWRIATVADRTSDELALMFQQFLGFHGSRSTAGDRASPSRRSCHASPPPSARCPSATSARGAGGGAGRPHRDADPLREPEERRRRPHRQRRGRLRPLRRARASSSTSAPPPRSTR